MGKPEGKIFGRTEQQLHELYQSVRDDNQREDQILLGPSTPNANFHQAVMEGAKKLAENPATRAVFSKIQEE